MEKGSRMADVFISYSADARKLAEKLAEALQKNGVSTWVDFQNVQPEPRVYLQLQAALDEARIYLMVIGPRNRTREWQSQEWQGAYGRSSSDPEKRMLPVLVGKVKSPSFLAQWPPLRIPTSRVGKALVEQILAVVRNPESYRRDPVPKPELVAAFKERLDRIEAAALWMIAQEGALGVKEP
jgi:hypothetical protein